MVLGLGGRGSEGKTTGNHGKQRRTRSTSNQGPN
jgi:hypothetical protein